MSNKRTILVSTTVIFALASLLLGYSAGSDIAKLALLKPFQTIPISFDKPIECSILNHGSNKLTIGFRYSITGNTNNSSNNFNMPFSYSVYSSSNSLLHTNNGAISNSKGNKHRLISSFGPDGWSESATDLQEAITVSPSDRYRLKAEFSSPKSADYSISELELRLYSGSTNLNILKVIITSSCCALFGSIALISGIVLFLIPKSVASGPGA